jgi:hypothetical protein
MRGLFSLGTIVPMQRRHLEAGQRAMLADELALSGFNGNRYTKVGVAETATPKKTNADRDEIALVGFNGNRYTKEVVSETDTTKKSNSVWVQRT